MQCRSAATAAIESAYLIKTGLSPSCINLSEQHLVDCVRGGSYKSNGCSGGYSDEVCVCERVLGGREGKRKAGASLNLSEPHLVDCSMCSSYKSNGCSGG